MTQRAGHSYHTDDNMNYGRNFGSSTSWIWGVIAALAALAVIAWFATSGGPTSNLGVTNQSAPSTTQETAPGTATGSTEPVQPVAPAPAPAQQPAVPAQ